MSHPEFLPRVFELTSNPKSNVRKEAFWLLSNVSAGTSDQIELILKQHKSMEKLKHGLISPLYGEDFLLSPFFKKNL